MVDENKKFIGGLEVKVLNVETASYGEVVKGREPGAERAVWEQAPGRGG